MRSMRAARRVVKMVDRYVNVLLNTIYIFQDISSISALIPCARGFVSPAITCLFFYDEMAQSRHHILWLYDIDYGKPYFLQ